MPPMLETIVLCRYSGAECCPGKECPLFVRCWPEAAKKEEEE